jgi:hypothetical protein
VSLFSELCDARKQGNYAYQQLLQRCNQNRAGMAEWVRMTSLSSKATGVIDDPNGFSSTQQAATQLSSMSNGIYSSVGGSIGNISQYSSGKLICILDRNITQPIQCAATKKTINLFGIWKQAGFSYTKATAVLIPIVVVDIKNQQYFYPADQVVRLSAPLLPSCKEAHALNNASLSLSQPQSQSQPQPQIKGRSSGVFPSSQAEVGSVSGGTGTDMCASGVQTAVDPVLVMLTKRLQGATIDSKDFDHYWRRCDHVSVAPDMHLPTRLEVNPRDGFCASKGYVLMTSDYCQIELRILAHFSMDENLCGAFCDPLSEDIFKCIASKWQGLSTREITSEGRNRVKQLCYALLYGAGPGKVASDANCTITQAEEWIKQFLGVYPGIKVFMSEVKSSCAKLGYVQTMLGRRRYLPHIRHAQRKERSRAERQAVNTVCQGSAADLIKLAMINIHHTLCDHFKGRNYHARRSVPGGGLYMVLDAVRPVLQIHDELVFEVHEKYVQEVAECIQHCMENAVELNVPLKVKINIGASFGSLEPLVLDPPQTLRSNTNTATRLVSSRHNHHSMENVKHNSSVCNSGVSGAMNRTDSTGHGCPRPLPSSDTPSSYDTRNRNRRESGNLLPHPLLVLSAAELLERTSKKRDREGDAVECTGFSEDNTMAAVDDNDDGANTENKNKFTKQQHQPQLPVARCIFQGD